MTLDEIVKQTRPKHIKVTFENEWFEVTIGENTTCITAQAETFDRALDRAYRAWTEAHRVR